jgi:type I restriction enzyme R subunit
MPYKEGIVMAAQQYPLQTNFAFLVEYDEQIVRLGMMAEKYFAEDPNTSLLKIRQYAELLAQQIATRVGAYDVPGERLLTYGSWYQE